MRPACRSLSTCLVITPWLCFAQTTYQKAIGGSFSDEGEDVIRTVDGSFVAAGLTVHPATFDQDIVVVNFTADGDTVWTRSIGSNGVNEAAMSVRQTSDGGFILCGTREIIGAQPGNILLLKTDNLGHPVWSRTYGGSAIETGVAALPTDDGGYIVLGNIEDISTPTDICLIRTDAVGDTTWTRILSVGANRYDIATSIALTNDGGFLITGKGFESGLFDGMYLIRSDMHGDVLWAKSATGITIGNRVSATSDGGCIVLGTSPGNSTDVHLFRADANGDTLWTRSYGGSGIEEAAAVVGTTDDGFLIAGATRSFGAGLSDAYLIRTDANGALIWSRSYGQGQHDRAFSVQEMNDGGCVAVGHTSSFGSGQTDLLMLRTDANGISGCFEMASGTAVHSPPVTVADVVMQSSSGLSVNDATVTWGVGSTVSTECLITAVRPAADIDVVFTVGPSPIMHGSSFQVNGNCGRLDVLDVAGRVVNQRTVRGRTDIVADKAGIFLLRFVACDGRSSTQCITIN